MDSFNSLEKGVQERRKQEGRRPNPEGASVKVMANNMKVVRNSNQSQRFRFVVLLIGCFVVSMTFIVVSRPQSISWASLSSKGPQRYEKPETGGDLQIIDDSRSQTDSSGDSDASKTEAEEKVNPGESTILDPVEKEKVDEFLEDKKPEDRAKPEEEEQKELLEEAKPEEAEEKKKPLEEAKPEEVEEKKELLEEAKPEAAEEKKEPAEEQAKPEEKVELEEKVETEENTAEPQERRFTLPTVPNYTIDDAVQEQKKSLPDLGGELKTVDRKPLCDVSDFRVDICDMNGDIRIPNNSSVVLFNVPDGQAKPEAWPIHPYPRKGDITCFSRVREVIVKSTTEAPQCTVHHDVPAIFFSIGGYAGNLFHDFTDLVIPLFLNARQYDGEVKFVVSDYNPYWIFKYLLVFQQLSKYPVIDYEKDAGVHCFKHVIVGLRCHKEFSIDPTRAPNGYSMVDFNKFMRSAYSLPREAPTVVEDLRSRRPRLLIIARKLTRTFTNLPEIVMMAEDVGFEVVIDEAELGSDVAKFAGTVNSCDVLMGVHGAGLTNMVFLPPNATVIQVVPWGGLEGISMYDFGDPAKDMNLNYMQYSIGIEESTLTEQYPRDHVVFTDPYQIHKQGFGALRSTFMDKQNVKLDVTKFRSVLWKALEQIIQ